MSAYATNISCNLRCRGSSGVVNSGTRRVSSSLVSRIRIRVLVGVVPRLFIVSENGVLGECPAVGEEHRLLQKLIQSVAMHEWCTRSDSMWAEVVASCRVDDACRTAGNINGQYDTHDRLFAEQLFAAAGSRISHYVTEAIWNTCRDAQRQLVGQPVQLS